MKKLLVTGSAAAEGIPALFCDCRVCRQARKNGGKDLRMRAGYMLGDAVRIDWCPDSYAQELKFGLDSSRLRHIFVTHSHEDHLVPDSLDYRRDGFSVVPDDSILNLYGDPGAIRKLYRYFWDFGKSIGFNGSFDKWRMRTVQLEPFAPVELPDTDMTFWPLLAKHMTESQFDTPFIYAIRWGTSYLMIANDTGVFPEETWKWLEGFGHRFHTVIADCTGGVGSYDCGHMCGKYTVEVKNRLASMSRIDDRTGYFINHFSHNGHAVHAELESFYAPYGIIPCWDGMTVDLDS